MIRTQATRFMRSAFSRCGAAAGETRGKATIPSKEEKYTYLPSGCSIREPTLISMSDPVYHYDLPPSRLSAAQQHAFAEEAKAKLQAEQPQQQQQGGLKSAFSAVLPNKPSSDKPISFRMADDMSNQTYVTSINHSMREPRLISVADPSYQFQATAKKAGAAVAAAAGPVSTSGKAGKSGKKQ